MEISQKERIMTFVKYRRKGGLLASVNLQGQIYLRKHCSDEFVIKGGQYVVVSVDAKRKQVLLRFYNSPQIDSHKVSRWLSNGKGVIIGTAKSMFIEELGINLPLINIPVRAAFGMESSIILELKKGKRSYFLRRKDVQEGKRLQT